ncbi:epoxyqueuosine reductase [Candidatus Soleaferrea massiliensis]|uniref:epoxyqueuosine reductase n=1 Tax=Candidatus Soleaferrea massiliensis TaxID=1470354 RepID=UPI0006933D46|nr:QueG-associated DUF1730 domain-containing protein [Candidatus Soleaferrea massiliensis]
MEPLQSLLGDAGIRHFGICRFTDTLPLLECRAKSRIPAGAQSVIVCLFPYYTGESPVANLSKYARVPDYHLVVGDLLKQACLKLRDAFPSEQFAAFADNSPIREVHAARMAGLGVVGMNGLLIHERFGSFCFIGEIVSTLRLPYSAPSSGTCRQCGRCRAVCPGQAFDENGYFLKERCLSFLTQKKGELTGEQRRKIQKSGVIWGCDRCQDICVHNRDLPITDIPAFLEDNVFRIDADLLSRPIDRYAFAYRPKSVLYRNLGIMEDEMCDTTPMVPAPKQENKD